MQTKTLTLHSTGRPRGAFEGDGEGYGQPAFSFSNLNFLPFVAYGAVALNVKVSGAYAEREFEIERFVQYMTYKEIHEVYD